MLLYKECLVSAIVGYGNRQYGVSLNSVFSCLSRLAKDYSPREKDGVRTKAYLKKRQLIIIGVMSAGTWKIGPEAGYSINGKGFEHHLYKYIRCGLSHEAELLPGIQFHESEWIGVYADRIIVPYRLCLGLILAAVSDQKAIRYLGGDLGLSLVSVTGRRLNLDDLIGKGDAIYDPVISFLSSNL